MKDLKTLLSSDATDFERQLLGAVAGERPSPELQLRMQQAIGLGPVALQGHDAGPEASTGGPRISGSQMAVKAAASRWGTWSKVVLGVGAGAALVAGVLALPSSQPAPLTPASAPGSEQGALPAPVEAPIPNAPSAAASPEAASPEAVSRELREEIVLLDRVRSALEQRDASAASALLESYANRFPDGKLTREASVLRARTAQVAGTVR